jgi:hypothetical protein
MSTIKTRCKLTNTTERKGVPEPDLGATQVTKLKAFHLPRLQAEAANLADQAVLPDKSKTSRVEDW